MVALSSRLPEISFYTSSATSLVLKGPVHCQFQYQYLLCFQFSCSINLLLSVHVSNFDNTLD